MDKGALQEEHRWLRSLPLISATAEVLYLASKGFAFNRTTKNWEAGGIRFPDALVDKPGSDESSGRHGTVDRRGRKSRSKSRPREE